MIHLSCFFGLDDSFSLIAHLVPLFSFDVWLILNHNQTTSTSEDLQKGQVRTHNRRACMIRCMNVDEARVVCKDRSRWRSVVSAYSHAEKGGSLCMSFG